MVWSIVWIFIEPPTVLTNKVSEDILLLIDSCAESSSHLIGQLTWQLLFVVICCYFAIRTRNLPANYNQSRFIAFTAFCSLVVFIAFTPAYFLSTVAGAKNLYCALGGIILATVVLLLLFIVRLYAVYFVKEDKQQAVTTPPTVPTVTEDDMTTTTTTKTTMLKHNDHYGANITSSHVAKWILLKTTIWRHVARVNLLAEWRIEESKHQPLEDEMKVTRHQSYVTAPWR